MIVRTAIVGMRFRTGINEADLAAAAFSEISLKRDPQNPHDKNAVKAIVEGKHIGFIARGDAKVISPMLANGLDYKVTFSARHRNSISVVVTLEEKNEIGVALNHAASQTKKSVKQYLPPVETVSNSNKDCFISTYVYGHDDPRTEHFRAIRDTRLNKTLGGRLFVGSYYWWSPKLVYAFGGTQFFKPLIKLALDALLRLSRYDGRTQDGSS